MLTHPVKVSWVRRNPKDRCSSVTWAFPKTFNDTELAGFERDLRGHYLIAPERKLFLLSVNGCIARPEYAILPFRDIGTLALTGSVTLTTREFVSPNNKLSTHKYLYADGRPIKAKQLVTTMAQRGTYRIVRGKGGKNRNDPLIKLKETTTRQTIVVRASELALKEE